MYVHMQPKETEMLEKVDGLYNNSIFLDSQDVHVDIQNVSTRIDN